MIKIIRKQHEYNPRKNLFSFGGCDYIRYSDLIITDDNFDENVEKLADENGFQYGQFIDFTKDLSKDFTKQINKNGYEEWVSVKIYPNHSIDCVSPIIISTVAYEFANGFMVFGERDSMYD